MSEQDRVLKFWNGARPVIQKGLWRDNLNPETSPWNNVIAQAEIFKISKNVADRRDRRSNLMTPGDSNHQQGKNQHR